MPIARSLESEDISEFEDSLAEPSFRVTVPQSRFIMMHFRSRMRGSESVFSSGSMKRGAWRRPLAASLSFPLSMLSIYLFPETSSARRAAVAYNDTRETNSAGPFLSRRIGASAFPLEIASRRRL